MKIGSTLFLKLVLAGIALLVLAICLFILPIALRSDATGYYRPIAILMYIGALPFFFALYHANCLLNFINRNQIFTSTSVASLRSIKHCAVIISLLFAISMPYIFYVADQDDAPGIAAVGFVIIFASFVIAAFAGVMQQLVQTAVDIKTENDLTV